VNTNFNLGITNVLVTKHITTDLGNFQSFFHHKKWTEKQTRYRPGVAQSVPGS